MHKILTLLLNIAQKNEKSNTNVLFRRFFKTTSPYLTIRTRINVQVGRPNTHAATIRHGLLFLLAMLYCSPLLIAQTNNTDSNGGIKHDSLSLQEVTVTASKISQKWAQTAKVVTLISDSVLQSNVQLSLSELLNREAGISIAGANNAGGTNQQMYMRGAAVGYTLLLIDGMPLSDPSAPVGSFDLNVFDVSQIKRIEILRGAQSSLYGSDAVAGVINIVTQQNTDKPIALKINAVGGSYLTHRLNMSLNGNLSGFRYNAQVANRISKGFSDAQDTTQTANYDRDRFRQNAYRLSVSKQVMPQLTLAASGQYAQYYADIDAAAYKDDRDYTAQNNNVFAGASLSYQIKKSQFRLQYSYDHISRIYIDDSTDVPIGAYAKYQFGSYKGSSHFVELYFHYPISPKINLLAGADWRNTNTRQQYYSFSDWGIYEEPLIAPDSAKIRLGSTYLSLTTQPLKNLRVELGSRANFHSLYGNNITYSVHAAYSLKNRIKIFTGIGSGFRAPSLYQLFSPYGNKSLQPELAQSFDGGIQVFPAGKDNTYLRLTYFNRHVKQIISGLNLLNPPYFKYFNMNQQRDQGIEAEAQWRVKKWFFSANYAYVVGKINTINQQTNTDTTYNNLIRRPTHSGNIQAAYQVLPKLLLGLRARWVGVRTDLFFDETTYTTQNKQLAAYGVYDFYARTQILPYIAVFADFRNLLNTEYHDITGYNTKKFNFDIGVSIDLSKGK